MEIIVSYRELNKAVTAAKKVGVSSTKDPLARFDCITLQVKKGYLRVGGIGLDTSYVTHLKPKEGTHPEDAGPMFFQNQDWLLVKKLGITSKQYIRIRSEGNSLIFEKDSDEETFSVTIATETVKVHSPQAAGDATESFEDVPWEERVRLSTMIGDSKLWLSLPDATLLRQGLDAALIAAAPWSAATIPYFAEAICLHVTDTPEYANEQVDYQSGRVLSIMGTDRRRVVETYIPLVRRGNLPVGEVSIGHSEMPDEEVEEPIFLTYKTVKMLSSLLDPEYPTRMRITYHQRSKADGLVPMSLVVTNGPSLIRVNIDMSGKYVSEDLFDTIEKGYTCTDLGVAEIDNKEFKRLEIVCNLRGIENSGVFMRVGDDRVVFQGHESGGQMRAELVLQGNDNSVGNWVEADPLLAIMKFLKGRGEFSVHSLKMTGQSATLEGISMFFDFHCGNTRIATSIAS